MMIFCCGCEKEVATELTSGKEIYPHRSDLISLPFWICRTCGNFVGCHHKTQDRTRPLGVIPTPPIKAARQHIHRRLDPLWKNGKINRKHLYNKLSKRLGYKYHTADIRSIDDARVVYAHIQEIEKELNE